MIWKHDGQGVICKVVSLEAGQAGRQAIDCDTGLLFGVPFFLCRGYILIRQSMLEGDKNVSSVALDGIAVYSNT